MEMNGIQLFHRTVKSNVLIVTVKMVESSATEQNVLDFLAHEKLFQVINVVLYVLR